MLSRHEKARFANVLVSLRKSPLFSSMRTQFATRHFESPCSPGLPLEPQTLHRGSKDLSLLPHRSENLAVAARQLRLSYKSKPPLFATYTVVT